MAKPEPKRWGQAVLGSLLVALGSALFGASRTRQAAKPNLADAGSPTKQGRGGRSGKAGGSPRPGAGRAKVRTKPRRAEAPPRTSYWPPPPPQPIEPTGEVHASEAKDRQGRTPVHRDSEALGYETGDASAGAVAKVMVLGVSLIVASVAGLFWFIGQAHRSDATVPPLTRQQRAVIVPPGPRLQDHPLHDIAMERKREEDLLTAYAWGDAAHQTARIPIARAQALVIGRPLDPLPVPAPAPAANP